MKKIIFILLFISSILYSANIEELNWPKGVTFTQFLEKHSIPISLYTKLDKEDKELCSEIQADNRFYLYTDDNGDFNQVLIPVSLDIQLHIYKDSKNEFQFQTLPVNYEEQTEFVAIEINESISNDIYKATGNPALAAIFQSLFKSSSANFRKMQKGDFIALKYTQKSYLGKRWGMPEIEAAMVQINKKPFYRFKNRKDDKYYDEKGVGFTKTFFFQIPLKYNRISSPFTQKRFHPVLKRYRAHLGTDFAAPTGRNIYAAGDGRVEFVGNRGGYGKTIIINHHNGYKTLYAHQSNYAKGIRSGKNVKKGELIGYVGTTGLSSGPHLHLGLYRNGVAIDPMSVIQKPKIEGLSGKDKTTFLANSKIMIDNINKEINNSNRTLPKKFNRLDYKSDINIF